jgi:hypothetical protein
MRLPAEPSRFALLTLLTAACASAPAPAPSATAANQNSPYPGPCSFVELQAVERPSPGRGAGPDNLGIDTVELVATYRPGGGDTARRGEQPRPVSYAFRVQKERVDDLRAHLQQQPEILCEGESGGVDANAPGPRVPTFEGQDGQRLPAEGAPPGPEPSGQ